MKKLHQQLLTKIKEKTKNKPFRSKHCLKTYCGTDDPSYNLSNPQMRTIAKNWLRKNSDLLDSQFIELLDSLYEGKTDTEKRLAGMFLEYLSKKRKKIDPFKIARWLDNLQGWCQVDSLCQSSFTAAELLSNWQKWKKLLIQLNKDENLNKKRASLVLLVKPVRQSENKELALFALNQIGRLKEERSKLITKTVSWLLREMVKKHRRLIKDYLEKNQTSLPAIAVRETKRKLETGKKT